MSRLQQCLERIERSSEQILALEFGPPGIFTNAIVKKPKINRILKDLEGDENSLFQVIEPRAGDVASKRRVVRADGKSIFTNDISQDNTRKTIVQIAQLNQDVLENKGKNPININIDANTPMDDLCKQAYDILAKYPNLIDNHEQLLQQVDSYRQEYSELENAVETLNDKLNDQKHQLHMLNMELSPKKSQSGPDSDDDDAILLAIAREEAEIRQLQHELDMI